MAEAMRAGSSNSAARRRRVVFSVLVVVAASSCGAASARLAHEGRFGAALTEFGRERLQTGAAAQLTETFALLDAETIARTDLTLAVVAADEGTLASALAGAPPAFDPLGPVRPFYHRVELVVRAVPDGPRTYLAPLFVASEDLPFGDPEPSLAARWAPELPAEPVLPPEPAPFVPRPREEHLDGGGCGVLDLLHGCSPGPRETAAERRRRLSLFDADERAREAEAETAHRNWEAELPRLREEHAAAVRARAERVAALDRALAFSCTDAHGERVEPRDTHATPPRLELDGGTRCTWTARTEHGSRPGGVLVRLLYEWPEGVWAVALEALVREAREGAPAAELSIAATDARTLADMHTLAIADRLRQAY